MAKRGRRAINGDGSIYQRESDKRWVGCFIVDGKRKYVYAKNAKEVREKLRKAQEEYKQGTLVKPSQLKVKDYLEHWIAVHGPSIKASTCATYHYNLEAHLIAALGHIPLQKLSTDQIQQCYADLREEGLQASTIHYIHTIFKSALADAVEWGKLGRNPCSKVKLPRKEKREMTVLTQEQVQILLTSIRGHKLECLISLALATGMRQGELLALHWSDVDFERKTLQIRRTLSYIPKKGLSEEEPKTATSRRGITLAPFAIEALKRHRTAQLEARVQAVVWEDRGLIFSNGQGGYLWRMQVDTAFKRLLADAGLPIVRFHDLRHTAAVALIIKGVHAKVIQEIFGHSSITITMDIYGHVFPSMQRDAMAQMDDFLRGAM